MRPLSDVEIKRIAKDFYVHDEAFLNYIRDMIYLLRYREREAIYTREWVAGFVGGMMYLKYREEDTITSAASGDMLMRIVAATLEALRDMPHGNSN